MKRLLMTLAFIVCLSAPVFAGHSVVGNHYCSCGTPGCIEDYPGECGVVTSQSSPDYSEIGIAFVAVLLWFRLKT